MIAQKSVQEILDTVKVEEVIQDFVNLRRRGVNLIGLCPFHNEKTPSFNVSPSKNIFKCFGCGKGGDAVQFLIEHEHFTFAEALLYIAKKYNIEVEETVVSQEAMAEKQHFESLYIVNQFASDFYQEQLFETDRGKSIGKSYFKERGFRDETIRHFGLGFAPNQPDALTTKAVGMGYNIEFLRSVGLTTQYERDFFRDRVIFPIHNLSGKIIAFAGRILVKDVKAPKYINSPETEIYNKSKTLYGAFFAKRAIRQEDECILVEGYTDVISLHQSGIENVVASSGTSLTVEQARLIRRYTPNVKILYDGDLAGIKAALRGVDILLEQDLNVRIVLLPDGEDPDSYLQQAGVETFKTYISQTAKDFITFKADQLMKEAGNDPVKKAHVIKDIISSIAKIPDPIKRMVYVRECSRIAQVSEQVLVNEMNKLVMQQVNKAVAEKGMPPPNAGELEAAGITQREPVEVKAPEVLVIGDEFQEKDLARILVVGGNEWLDESKQVSVAQYIVSNIEEVLDHFDNALYGRIAREVWALVAAKKPVTQQFFLQHEDTDIKNFALGVLTSPYEYSENWEKKWDIHLRWQKSPETNFEDDSRQALVRFKMRKIEKVLTENRQKIKELSDAGEHEQVLAYMKVLQKLLVMRSELAAQTGAVVLK
ncbi:MAG: DNA primase [Saprospiraceae bacterium]|nr:DNA primase [Saprospiraceae bacterium]